MPAEPEQRERKAMWRERTANVLFLLSVALLFGAHACLSACWVYAWQNNIWPNGPFEGYRGGPWASRNPKGFLEFTSELALLLSALALLPAAACAMLKPDELRSGKLLAFTFLNLVAMLIFVGVVTED
jgi:hypothetical protein